MWGQLRPPARRPGARVTIPVGHGTRVALLAAITVLGSAGFLALADAVTESESLVDLDLRVERWVATDMPSWAEWLARPFTWAGGLAAVLVLTGAVAAWLVRAGRRSDALVLLSVTVGVQVVVPVLKSIYDRPRPDAGSPIDLPRSTSFPSGHAATGVAVFGALALLAAGRARSRRAAAGVLAAGLLVGVAIGASRVVLNVHFVSDVLAGFCVGLAWLCACLLVRELVGWRAA